MLITKKIKQIAFTAILPFVLLINSCEQATVKPVTQVKTLNCVDANLQDYLIAYYPFTDGSLDNYINAGYKLTSNYPVEKTNDRHDNPDCAIYMNQNNQEQSLYLDFGDPITNPNLTEKEYSISIWYKALEEDKRSGGDFELLIGNNNTFPNTLYEDNWYIGLYDCRRPTSVMNKINIWDKGNFQQLGSCEAVIKYFSGTWFHLVITHKEGKLNMYINGKLENTSESVSNTIQVIDGTKALTIGKNFRGNFDEIMIFDKELTWDEVLKLYSATPCCE